MSEARVATALDKLAYMEALVNDRLLQDRSATVSNQTSPSPSTSTQTLDVVQRRLPRKSLDVSGPVQPYHPHLKNFWYPVAFSNDLKDDTMVSYNLKSLWFILYVLITYVSIRINKSTRVALHFCHGASYIVTSICSML
jgi:hypothetical protein